MSHKETILFPIGRLVQGSLYDPQTTDAENRPLVYKSGANIGQPRFDYFFAFAVEKNGETHWNQTEWGAKIWAVGLAGFPNGQAIAPTFAWKVKDGDSTIPNRVGRRPCDCEGFPGHWILNFNRPSAPQICNETGTEYILEPDFVKLGDYVQVYGEVRDNESLQQPGVYLNHSAVAFVRTGQRIVIGVDVKSVGFGKSALPRGALDAAKGNFTPPAVVNPPLANSGTYSSVTPPPVPPLPHSTILTPPAPPAPPVHAMTAKAEGMPYESFIASGWTDALLVQHGLMMP